MLNEAIGPGTLKLGLVGTPSLVLAERDAAVSDGFWNELRLEWGFAGQPQRAIQVEISRFLTRLDWLKPACHRFRVKLDWDPGLVRVLRANQAEKRQAESLMANSTTLSPREVNARLSGGRYRRVLRDFQLRDAGRLLAMPHGANFSVPGAGKTSVALCVYEAERLAGRVQRMLVVAPLSAFDAWSTEIAECFGQTSRPELAYFSGQASADMEILLLNYHRLASSYHEIAGWVQSAPSLVLLDEAHRMKRGRLGQHGSACLNLAFLAERRDILTGTPAPQAPSDFVALLDYLWPGQAAKIVPRAARAGRPADGAVTQVASALRPLFVRTRKAELGLDRPRLRLIETPLEGLHKSIYDALRDRYSGELHVSMTDRNQLARMGGVVMYLLEAATNPQLLASGSDVDDVYQFRHPPLPVPPASRLWELIQRYSQYETPTKFQALAKLVEEKVNLGRKVLIWSNFVRNLRILEQMFGLYNPALVYGAVPNRSDAESERSREKELARFRTDPGCMILLANPAAMSEGVSLHHTCHDAVYLDRTFNAGQYLQSVDRIHRLGLEPGTDTNLYFLVTSDTVDQVVDSRIQIKAERLGRMLDDPDLANIALPDDEDFGPALDSTDDLKALFAHLRGEG